MASSEEVIKVILASNGIRRDKDLEELCLSNRNLAEVSDLGRFRFLKILWLSGNKLQQVNFLGLNLRISELHLDNNYINTIKGFLRHLTCLNTLSLHNNYLADLVSVLEELDKMKTIRVLTLFDNPVALEPKYRRSVINSLPSLTRFDNQEITKTERDKASRLFHQNWKVKGKIAFGRKSKITPPAHSPAYPRNILERPETPAKNHLKNIPSFKSLEEAASARQQTYSRKMYKMLDWSTIPRYEERREMIGRFESPRFIKLFYR